MKNKKSFIEKQIKNIPMLVFEEDLSNFTNPVSVTFDKDIKVFSKGGVVEIKKRYKVVIKQYSSLSYNELVNGAIRDKYSESEEFAILRKAINNPTNEEFAEYNIFAEQCKKQAQEFIQEREDILKN